ncbi:Uncharacterised protein [Candidatus Venteria ishoeyi]|uniref:Uncharacterized protein n=1 Tax=Candidatus Venteria ishoeyi TaxID=1899563 RepID=A0A1H6F8D9_9GAMM|nr:Uncharacterised protein [Candidatus Venteria ishoeyi]
MVSEHLKCFTKNLPSTLNTGQPHRVFYLSDEIFAFDYPILITIAPVSTAILCIELASDRKTKTWKVHFEALDARQFTTKCLDSDWGNGLVQGYQAAYQEAVWSSDHFHEFRGLSQLCSRRLPKTGVGNSLY